MQRRAFSTASPAVLLCMRRVMVPVALFDEEMKQVGFKEPVNKILLIDIRAAQLGMKRSEYLRHLVDEDLKLAGIA